VSFQFNPFVDFMVAVY